MYRAGRYTNARQKDINTRSYTSTINEDNDGDLSGNARINVSRRIHSPEYPIDMPYARTLTRFYYCSGEVRKVEELTIASLFQEPPTFMLGDQELVLTTEFQNTVNTEYARFNEDAHVAIQTLGFVPVHFVLLASALVVPRVVDINTYEMSVYTDYMAEAQCYRVYRIIDGKRHEWNTKTVRTNFTNGSAQTHLDALHEDMMRDPRETASMRMDMGVQFPKTGEVDPTIFVYDGFGARPTSHGKLQSVMNTIYLAYQKVHHLEQLYFESLRQHMSSQPYIESSDASEEQLNQGVGMAAFDTREEAIALKARDRMAEQQYDLHRVNMIHRQQRIDSVKASLDEFTTSEQLYASEIDQEFSESTSDDIISFDSSAPVFSAAYQKKSFGVPLLPGEKISGYSRQQTRFEHLPMLLDNYKTTVSNLLGKPPSMFDMNRGTQDQIALHLRNYFKIRHAQVKARAGLLTTVYNQIYAPSESSWYAHVFFDRFLRKEVIQRIALDYRLYYTHIKAADPRLYALLKHQAEAMQDVVIQQISAKRGRKIAKPPPEQLDLDYVPKGKKRDVDNKTRRAQNDTPFKKLAEPGGVLDDGLETRDKDDRAWQAKYHAPQIEGEAAKIGASSRTLMDNPTKVLRKLQQVSNAQSANGTQSIAAATVAQEKLTDVHQQVNKEQQYDDMQINEEIRALMFIAALQQQDSDTIFSIYTQPGEAQASLMRKMFENFARAKNQRRITITFKSAANLNLPDLLARVVCGYISEKESFDIVRTQMFMPVDTDKWTDSKKLKAVLDIVRQNIAGSVTQALGVKSVGAGRGGASSGASDSSSTSRSKRAKLASTTDSDADQSSGAASADEQLSESAK